MIELLSNIEFANPWFLLLLGLIPFGVLWYFLKIKKKEVSLTLPSLQPLEDTANWRTKLVPWVPLLRLLSFAFLVIALARPQLSMKEEEIKAEGIDIMLVSDLSSSMLAQDFQPNRLEVSKRVAKEFVDKRKYDRIGLAVFAGESFTQCPLTTDHRVIKDFIDNLQCGILEDGTAIGMGMASAVNRLKSSEANSKVIILLTDGVNNSGYVKPLTAAEIAQEYNIRTYTIGIGTEGQALSPVGRLSNGQYHFGMAQVEIDEKLLQEIADKTGGQYYRAISEQSLIDIYAEIDRLEKTEIDVTAFRVYSDEYRYFMLIGLGILLFEIILKIGFLRTLP